jgi:hypothetical protein
MVQIAFYVLTIAAIAMLFLIFKNSIPHPKVAKSYTLVCLIWLIYVVILNRLGILQNFDLPPRVPLFLVIPAVTAIIVITGRKSFATILQVTPLHIPVLLQSFRIFVEILIYEAFLEGVFPERATFKGINFDILVGISSVVIGIMVFKKRVGSKVLLTWNVISLMVLTVTVYSFISTYYFTDYLTNLQQGVKSFVDFPYLLLASVLLPIAVFLHVFSIRQAIIQLRLSYN